MGHLAVVQLGRRPVGLRRWNSTYNQPRVLVDAGAAINTSERCPGTMPIKPPHDTCREDDADVISC